MITILWVIIMPNYSVHESGRTRESTVEKLNKKLRQLNKTLQKAGLDLLTADLLASQNYVVKCNIQTENDVIVDLSGTLESALGFDEIEALMQSKVNEGYNPREFSISQTYNVSKAQRDALKPAKSPTSAPYESDTKDNAVANFISALN